MYRTALPGEAEKIFGGDFIVRAPIDAPLHLPPAVLVDADPMTGDIVGFKAVAETQFPPFTEIPCTIMTATANAALHNAHIAA